MSRLRELGRDQSGASMLLTVLTLPVLIGFTAFAIDGGMAYMGRRNAQNAADSAAFTAAAAWAKGETDLQDQARGVAQSYGLKDGANGVTVTVNRPATTGTYAGNPKAIEVVVTRPMSTFFSSLFGMSPGVLRARSVALGGQGGDVCVLALNPTKTWSMLVNGAPTLKLNGCVMQVNSGAAQAMLGNGTPTITADQIRLVGGYLLNGGGLINLKNGWKTGAEAVPDPYADKTDMPQPGSCTPFTAPPQTGSWTAPVSGTGVTTYCTSLVLNGTVKTTFPDGIYIFAKGASFTTNGSPQVTGKKVSFIFAKNGASSGGLTWNGDGKLDLGPPTDGPMQGILIFTDPAALDQPDATINGANDSKLQGAIHLPRAMLTINGTNALEGGCLEVIADSFTVNGGGTFGLACDAIGLPGIGGKKSSLVE